MLANRTGCVVVSVNYQKAPEHPFPVPVEDVLAAFYHIARDTAGFGIDPLRIGLAGDRAGANLALGAALSTVIRRKPRPIFLVLLYPALDPTLSTESMARYGGGAYLLSAAGMESYWDAYVPELEHRSDPLVNALMSESLAELPATVLVLPGCDPLRDEGRVLAERLRAEKVPLILRGYPGAVHGLVWMASVSQLARQAFDQLGRDVRYIAGVEWN